jgi:hypothetical protein
MTRVRLMLGLAVLVAVVFPASAVANPPIPGTYDLRAGGVDGPSIGVVNVDPITGAKLVDPSFVEAACVPSDPLITAHANLAGIPINNPAGVINAFPTDATTSTLTMRFFIRWFPSVSSAPTGQTFSLPPGDTGSGNFSGRNNSTTAFCSFNLNFVAVLVSPPPPTA